MRPDLVEGASWESCEQMLVVGRETARESARTTVGGLFARVCWSPDLSLSFGSALTTTTAASASSVWLLSIMGIFGPDINTRFPRSLLMGTIGGLSLPFCLPRPSFNPTALTVLHFRLFLSRLRVQSLPRRPETGHLSSGARAARGLLRDGRGQGPARARSRVRGRAAGARTGAPGAPRTDAGGKRAALEGQESFA